MSNQQQTTRSSSKLERLELSNRPKLVITKKLQQQIDWLHQKVGNAEWSGELITREEGSITDLDNWTIYAEDIYLADIGSGVFTGYQVDQGGFKAVDIIDMYEAFPGLLDGTHKAQHIHTHHNMGAFFSPTDEENLEERAQAANYFMMLVVDFKGTYKAKVAFHATIPASSGQAIEFKNNHDGYSPLTLGASKEKEVLVVMDVQIVQDAVEDLLTPAFKARYTSVKEAIEEDKKSRYSAFSKEKNYTFSKGKIWDANRGWIDPPNAKVGKQTQIGFGEDPEKKRYESKGKRGRRRGKDKKISEMTDREFAAFERQSEITPFIWQDHHFRAVMNAYLDQDVTKENTGRIFNRLFDLNQKLHLQSEREDWILDFMTQFEYYQEALYPEHATLEDQSGLLAAGIREFTGYGLPLIVELRKEMIEAKESIIDELNELDAEEEAAIEEANAEDAARSGNAFNDTADFEGYQDPDVYDEEWQRYLGQGGSRFID